MLNAFVFPNKRCSKGFYKNMHDQLMSKLVVLQQQARLKGVGLVVLLEGWDGAGKGSRLSDLMYHLDARATNVYISEDFTSKDLGSFPGTCWGVTDFYPLMQEFWRALGPRGNITFYDRGWYSSAMKQALWDNLRIQPASGDMPIEHREVKRRRAIAASEELCNQPCRDKLSDYISSARYFERQLVDDGYVVVKFFVHVREEAQKRRLRRLYDNPDTRWRVSKEKLEHTHNYQQEFMLYDNLLERSSFSFAPWKIINGENKYEANLDIATTLVRVLQNALRTPVDKDVLDAAHRAAINSAGSLCSGRSQGGKQIKDAQSEEMARQDMAKAPRVSRFQTRSDAPTLDGVNHGLVLEPVSYKKELKTQQKRLNLLEMQMYRKRIPLIIMYEGWDAAGKGGNIKRVAQALDARAYTIFPSPAPTKLELMHPHLWRYWTHLPKAGHVGIYDRSWYGRVLVERVEHFATPKEWARAYDEINEFESELIRWGAILLKFWVDVSAEEQLRRFCERRDNPAKQWKITEEDWRNRNKWPQYKAAVDDMFRLTSTTYAPWIVLQSNDKRYARVKALKLINNALEARLCRDESGAMIVTTAR